MSGHGHVTPNPAGSKARCGGPPLCAACARELAEQTSTRVPTWDEGIERLLAKLPRLVSQEQHLTINDVRVIQHLAATYTAAKAKPAAGDIEVKVDAWHNGAGEGRTLHEYLGMTWGEYAHWVETGGAR